MLNRLFEYPSLDENFLYRDTLRLALIRAKGMLFIEMIDNNKALVRPRKGMFFDSFGDPVVFEYGKDAATMKEFDRLSSQYKEEMLYETVVDYFSHPDPLYYGTVASVSSNEVRFKFYYKEKGERKTVPSAVAILHLHHPDRRREKPQKIEWKVGAIFLVTVSFSKKKNKNRTHGALYLDVSITDVAIYSKIASELASKYHKEDSYNLKALKVKPKSAKVVFSINKKPADDFLQKLDKELKRYGLKSKILLDTSSLV